MSDIKIIALDLDGTLLNSNKEISPKNLAALKKAADAGIEIVPTTGRFFGAMPEAVRSLPFIHYAITVNGAQVYDINKDIAVDRQELTWRRAIDIMEYFDTLPVIYDCYLNNWGWMTRAHWEKIKDYVFNPHYIKMVTNLRTPVPDLKEYLRENKYGVQKVQSYFIDMELRDKVIKQFTELFPDTVASTSADNNIEVNDLHANKGEALKNLAAYLGYDISQTMALGDGLNDLSMIREAGIGVAMGNAHPDILALAKLVTADCDHDGVAEGIERVCFGY